MKRLLVLFMVLCLALSFAGCTFENIPIKEGEMRVHFINVDQADSILIQLPNSKNMLIDAGNNKDGKNVVSYIKKQNITKLDFLVGTHPDADHIGGLDDVIKALDVDKFYTPKVSHNTETFKDVLEAAKAKSLSVNTAKEGVEMLAEDKLSIKMFAPNSESYKDTNDYSAVIKIVFDKTSFLFTGDAMETSEKEMLEKGVDLKSDVLKVGHHGSHSSTTQPFLDKVNPKYAVISCGEDSKYGHPHQETLDKLNAKDIKIYRTDKMGTIIASSDGNNIVFAQEKGVSN